MAKVEFTPEETAAHNKFGYLYDIWKWLGECPFPDGQPFIETAWNAGLEEVQKEAYEALYKLENAEITRLLGELSAGENSEDEIYALIEAELNK